MLDDRSYMQSPPWKKHRSATIAILIVNAVVFVLYHLFSPRYPELQQALPLSYNGLAKGYIWQLFTFQFLHAGFLHILLNSWGIFMFGRAVEDTLGRNRFLVLYFGSGVMGGLLHVLGSSIAPANFGSMSAPMVGASAGLFGLLAAFARLFPFERLTLLIFFVLPVTLTARTLLIVSGALAVAGLIIPNAMGGGVAHGAHLGGLLAGLAYVQWFRHSEWNFQMPQWLQKFKMPRKATPRPMRATPSTRASTIEMEEFTPDFITKEVDPILDKISANGIQSLTERERRILEAARARMAKR